MLETSKNADKKGFVGIVLAAQSVQKRAHKKDFVTTVSPTLWRPRETHQGPAGGVVYKNRAILWERGSPLPAGSWLITTGTGGGKHFQLWRSDRAGGTASLAKGKGPWYNVHDPLGFALVLWLGGWRKGFSYATKLRLDARRGIARCTRSPLQEDREVVAACTKL